MKVSKQTKTESMEMLHEFLKPGSKVYTIIRSVSRSGMSRTMDLYTFANDEKVYLTGYAANVIGYSRDKCGALKVSGCGMDMGFHVVYCLSRCMFPDGYTLPEGKRGRNGAESGFDRDGGYAIQQEWL